VSFAPRLDLARPPPDRRVREVARWRRSRWSCEATPTVTARSPRSASSSPSYPAVRWCWPKTRPISTCCPGYGRPGLPMASGSRS
jgi:hypothetical protein